MVVSTCGIRQRVVRTHDLDGSRAGGIVVFFAAREDIYNVLLDFGEKIHGGSNVRRSGVDGTSQSLGPMIYDERNYGTPKD